jgi:3-hydroxyisobutyrate dehydrogenase
LDCSTIAPRVSIELNQEAKSKGMTYIDAPVSGGVTGAQAGTLTFMVGAENTHIFDKSK